MAAQHWEGCSITAMEYKRIWVAQIMQCGRWPTAGFSITEKSRSTCRMAPAQGSGKSFHNPALLVSMEDFFLFRKQLSYCLSSMFFTECNRIGENKSWLAVVVYAKL